MKKFESHGTEVQIIEVLFVSTIVGLLAALAIPNAVDARCSLQAVRSSNAFPPAREIAVPSADVSSAACPSNAFSSADSVVVASSFVSAAHWVPSRFATPSPVFVSF